uniref:EF-hand domain-containing protein n=1 Tax=Zooxanthella nutricula TaxID=1333877 RepID=A0A7S2PJW5_9DINO
MLPAAPMPASPRRPAAGAATRAAMVVSSDSSPLPTPRALDGARPKTTPASVAPAAPDGVVTLAPLPSARGPSQPSPPGCDLVVEARAAVKVVLDDASSDKVPAHHWIVLESPLPADVGDGDGREVKLCACAGGGTIPQEAAQLLRPVDPLRLHALAAEANFQRAIRGKSVLALRHAAHVLDLLGERDHEPNGGDVARAFPTIASLTTSSATLRASPSCERLKRAEALVSSQAAAAERWKHSQEMEEERHNVYPPLAKNEEMFKKTGVCQSALRIQKGCQALDEFLEFAHRRFGNVVRLWFMLDPEENMKLGEKMFVRRCLDLGFRGNLQALWHYLDCDTSGSTSLLEVDAKAACILAHFQAFLVDLGGNDTDVWFQMLDGNRTGRVSKSEFVTELQRLKYTGPARLLFEMLDRGGQGMITTQDFAFLAKWEPRPYLHAQPDIEAKEAFERALFEVYGEWPFKIWRKVLDRDGSMRVSWDEFRAAVPRITRLFAHMPAAWHALLPRTEREIANVWRAYDQDTSGWISLGEFHKATFDVLVSFKLWAQSSHGGPSALFRKLDHNDNGRLSLDEFEGCYSMEDGRDFRGDIEAVFDHLDIWGNGFLTQHDVAWMELWDTELAALEGQLRQHSRQVMGGHLQCAMRRSASYGRARSRTARLTGSDGRS